MFFNTYNNVMDKKEIPLGWLNYGQKFVINGLVSYRNTRLVRSNDCSAVIAGERMLRINDKEVWAQIPQGYTISPYTMVLPI